MFQSVTIKNVKSLLGVWSRSKRIRYGMSQKELAELIGVSTLTIIKFEKGGNATLNTVFKVLKEFGLLQEIYQYLDADLKDDSVESLY